MTNPASMRPAMGALLQSCRAGAHIRPSSLPSSSLNPSLQHTAAISTTSSLLKRHNYKGARDNSDKNKTRGESAIRQTGTRWKLSVSDDPLPQPVKPEHIPAQVTDPNHGLWDFFFDRKTVAQPPTEDAKHGRGWMVEELRQKSWDDLHRLWWVCVKERNRIATANWERTKSQLGYGKAEATARDVEVRRTMRAIKHVLTERFYTWEDAVKLAETDPEVNLTGNGEAYTPTEYLEEQHLSEEEPVPEEEEGAKKEAGAATLDPAALPESKTQGEAPRL
ncbi:mitochondrial 39-S ribosomal protein L47 (MRP-L47)-domain-containing protein [Bombardia bombarda]|uniref:Large ribosomal subunit protein uL29m n=1 Tax=Bombardia bombarda TaxID=252184 RepID=A0AA39X9X6_9PEZI|nr:mitochondrial 39-S ribosomal protein L47 (MRP-L47)-domain-containing protein [Bombardia bombarda]